jgi:hypothetical protein
VAITTLKPNAFQPGRVTAFRDRRGVVRRHHLVVVGTRALTVAAMAARGGKHGPFIKSRAGPTEPNSPATSGAQLPRVVESPRRARVAWRGEDLRLVISGLTINVIVHARTTFSVTLQGDNKVGTAHRAGADRR